MKIFEDKFGTEPLSVIPNAQEAITHYGCIKYVWRRAFETIKTEFMGSGCNVKDVIGFIDEELDE